MNHREDTRGPAVADRSATGKRSKSNAEQVERIERTEPLLRRILEALYERGTTPTELADLLRVRKESVSRLLTGLRDEGLVESQPVPGDKRQRRYTLTPSGEVELSRHQAYGAPAPIVSPSTEERVSFLYSALERAVQMRRQTNQLEEAVQRIRIVLRQARKIGDGGLVVEATNELATTLRQEGREEELAAPLEELEEIALGRGQYNSPGLAMPALAHREYALGRSGGVAGEGLRQSRDRLVSATGIYAQLASAHNHLPPGKWKERQAWSLVSQAGNLRAGSHFEEALGSTAAALGLFEEIDDPYGRSHCLFQFGFCLRLLGDFDEALGWLKEAHKLAEENSFERFQADSLMQIGEALRCLRDLDGARGALEESRERSMHMGLGLTQAFAHSGLGAVAFHQGRFLEAQLELNRAQERFADIGHQRGLVLNALREVSVARRLYQEEHETLETVERLTATALTHCELPRNPAGIAACNVSRGRLALLRSEDPAQCIDSLRDLLDHQTPDRELLELDPWLPGVMHEFAVETQDEPFEERSKRLLETARERLREAAKAGVQKAVDLVGRRGECNHDSPPRPADFVDEMAGETRQLTSRTEEPALTTGPSLA